MQSEVGANRERGGLFVICLVVTSLSASCNQGGDTSGALRSVEPTKHESADPAATQVKISEAAALQVARSKPYPNYPGAALVEKREGRVVVRIATGADGGVRDVNIMESTDEAFASSVREALQQWHLSPVSARSPGSPPSPVTATLAFYFRIADGAGIVTTGSEIAERRGLPQ